MKKEVKAFKCKGYFKKSRPATGEDLHTKLKSGTGMSYLTSLIQKSWHTRELSF